MNKILLAFALLLLAACATNKKEPTVITVPKNIYTVIPDDFFVCEPPPVNNDVEGVEFEEDYNFELVIPLFDNNVQCYQSIQRIKRFNDEMKKRKEQEEVNN